jgi:translation elongation factor EF-Tu-like GTPase
MAETFNRNKPHLNIGTILDNYQLIIIQKKKERGITINTSS